MVQVCYDAIGPRLPLCYIVTLPDGPWRLCTSGPRLAASRVLSLPFFGASIIDEHLSTSTRYSITQFM